MASEGAGSASPGRPSKVERVIADYELEGVAAEFERRWTEPEEEARSSLRELADEFNVRVLESAMEEEGIWLLDGQVENTYRLLADEDVSAGKRAETREKLEGEGLEVDTILSDFVSHQAIYTYLRKRRGVHYQKSPVGDRTGRELEKLSALENRTANVSEDALRRLVNAGELETGEFSVSVTIEVRCESCLQQLPVKPFIEANGCGCSTED